MRKPKVGETLKCAVCMSDSGEIDKDWLKHFNAKSDEQKDNMYNKDEDAFLGYCGCEHPQPS